MSFPSQPPSPQFKWPPKWEDWQWDFIEWCKSRQPLPDPTVFDVSESAQGVRFGLKPFSELIQYFTFPLKLVKLTGSASTRPASSSAAKRANKVIAAPIAVPVRRSD